MTAPALDVELRLAAALGDGALVVGIDEVGRGAVAGPVAVGAVAVDPTSATVPEGLRDSKLLTAGRRQALLPTLRAWGLARSVGVVAAREVDAGGIVGALGAAGAQAIRGLQDAGVDLTRTVVLLDGSFDWLSAALPHAARVVTRTKADRDCASVAAASVLAKTHRDAIMVEAARRAPQYGWASNKGYGSADHLAAIREHGPHAWHRLTFLRAHLAEESVR